MPDSNDYRLYLDKCFEEVKERFDSVEKSQERIEKHLEKQNSSIYHLQEESNKRAVVVEDFRHLEKEFDEFIKEDGQFDKLKKEVTHIDKELDFYYLVKKNPKFAITAIAVIVIFVGMGIVRTVKGWGDKANEIEMRQDINELNYQLKRIYGIDMRTRGGVNIKVDSLNKK